MMIKIENNTNKTRFFIDCTFLIALKTYMNIVLNEVNILSIYGNKKSTDYRRIFIHDYSSERMG